MTVIIKSSNYSFLEKLKVDADIIWSLKNEQAKVILGLKTFQLFTKNGLLITTVHLPFTINQVMKNTVQPMDYDVEGLNTHLKKMATILTSGAVITHPFEHALESPDSGFKVIGVDMGGEVDGLKALVKALSNVPDSAAMKALNNLSQTPLKKMGAGEFSEILNKPSNHGGPYFKKPSSLPGQVPLLRDATEMYQQVKGTSAEAKYFVVAMNSQVKLAVKLSGMAMALRAEGELTPAVVKQLNKAKMDLKGKGEYMSGHFQCNDNAPPSHLLGSLLTATELEFDTPMPNIKKIGHSE